MKGRQRSTTVSSRVDEYRKHGMYLFDRDRKIMMCKYCNQRVGWERKSIVDQHINSESHKNKKTKFESGEDSKKQASVTDSFEAAKKSKVEKDEFIKSTVNVFLKANIPVHRVDHPEFRKWLTKYVPGGGNLPNARWLRKHFIPQIKKEHDAALKAKLKGKKIIVLTDETTNIKGEAALGILFKILPTCEDPESCLVVASVKNLTACTGDQTSKAILQALQDYNVPHSSVVGLVSDGAAYMTLCARLLRELGLPEMIHIQCWAHKMDKVVKVFYDKLVRLNECVSKTKKMFKNTRKRKHKYFKYLQDTYSFTKAKEPKLFPMPVLTRWGSWRRSVEYLSEYVDDIVCFAKTISDSDSVFSVDYFEKLSDEDIVIIKAEATFVVEYCTPVSQLLVELEASKRPMSHILYTTVNDVRKAFSTVDKNYKDVKKVLYEKTKATLSAMPATKVKNFEGRILSVCQKSNDILRGYISNDPARQFFKSCQILFDPRFVVSSSNDEKVEVAKEKIHLFSSIPTPNFKVLHAILVDTVKEALKTKGRMKSEEDTVEKSLFSMKEKYPEFVMMCSQVLQVSVSNVDCERFFSFFKDDLTPNSNKLLPENTEIIMCSYFGDSVMVFNDNEGGEQCTSTTRSVPECDFESDPDDPEPYV